MTVSMTSSGVISAEDFAEGLVAIFGNVIFDIFRIDLAAIAQDHAHFLGVGSPQFLVDECIFLSTNFGRCGL